MNEPSCNDLDDYLTGAPDDRRRAEFERHLEACSICREEVFAHAELARLLRAATDMLEAPPAKLTASISRGVAVATSRRRRRVAVAAMIATMVACAVGWGLRNARDEKVLVRPQPEQRIAEEWQTGTGADEEGREAGEPETANISDATVAAPAVQVASVSEAIAVPIESENPNVTIFWLYPTTTAAEQ